MYIIGDMYNILDNNGHTYAIVKCIGASSTKVAFEHASLNRIYSIDLTTGIVLNDSYHTLTGYSIVKAAFSYDSQDSSVPVLIRRGYSPNPLLIPKIESPCDCGSLLTYKSMAIEVHSDWCKSRRKT